MTENKNLSQPAASESDSSRPLPTPAVPPTSGGLLPGQEGSDWPIPPFVAPPAVIEEAAEIPPTFPAEPLAADLESPAPANSAPVVGGDPVPPKPLAPRSFTPVWGGSNR